VGTRTLQARGSGRAALIDGLDLPWDKSPDKKMIVAGTGVARATSSRGIPNVIDRGGLCGRARRVGGGAGEEDKKETREVRVYNNYTSVYPQNTNRHHSVTRRSLRSGSYRL